MRKIALIALAGALALSACGKKQEEAPAANNLVEPPVENVIIDEPDTVPEPSQNVTNTAPAAPPPAVSEDQQMLDDAAATGMTSRLPSQADADRHADEASNAGG
ncbi:ABC-type glycerol-3-phosphate transport system substrate-binding protein [Sphingobium wenxiniae]|uniref:Argininosuccinate lyase n=2 Tax=Sphingobium TaxID=165695 RepID=T0GMX6_9SPHN|nr:MULTISPECIES: hypothetical protein [Sphingobium]EQB01368.1 hypothetical protein L485_10865 [Sphingobium baderi LL03]KMS60882.1 hypothetical protein V475_16715 [Sphingobium baderi LL03]MBB6191426.1 ABC-type glycerol-3-phosphate transport system substrate-binding protein [Sphingobium wenxiniae]TWH93281.1 hypothetical protein IQ35_02188 [Sphingobium wenxiniae]WRD76178.1 hypothetical protein QQ987_15635 [Sphingobium baderi]